MTAIQSNISSASDSVQMLHKEATSAMNRSHSPYSECKVGAAIRFVGGNVYSGCNVENASYGASICAERTAIVKAVSTTGKAEIEEILVITDATPPWPPCGICRQMISEFVGGRSSSILVHAVNLQGAMITYRWLDLFPSGFTPEHLK